MGVWFGNAQGPHSRQRAHRRAGRLQPDHGAVGPGGRVQGDLSLGRDARLGEERHRGESDVAGNGRRGGRHPRLLQAAAGARRRRRLGRPGACASHRRACRSRGLRGDRDRGPALAAAGRAPRRHRPSGADRILRGEAQGGARRAHRSRTSSSSPAPMRAAPAASTKRSAAAKPSPKPAPTWCSASRAIRKRCAWWASGCRTR